MIFSSSPWRPATTIIAALLLGLLVSLPVWPAMAAPPGMPDPRAMSGIPRPDPSIPAGTLTVRCLEGSFAEPAVGVVVTLELTAADGETRATRTATSAAQGRATFEGLEAFAGGVGVAQVEIAGELVKSQPILIDPGTGTALLLVKGGAQPASTGGAPHGPGAAAGAGHGMPSLREGVPFPLPPPASGEPGPKGRLIVGVIEPGPGQPDPRAGVRVVLELRPPGAAEDTAELERREATTDADGRVNFDELAPPAQPEGTRYEVSVYLDEEGEPRRSPPFEMGEAPQAMIFTPSGRLDRADTPAPHGAGGAGGSGPPQGRRPLPPPVPNAELAAGVVEVVVLDGRDAPVANQQVELTKRDLTGRNETYEARTGPLGVARFTEVDVRPDAFYSVSAVHQGAPYQSGFFELLDTMGQRVHLRVFPTTDDPRVVRSAVQIELRPLENDFAQVLQVYEVYVEGDAAYWPRGGMRIYGAEGSRNLKVLPGAQRWLREHDAAPFATLAEPIEPGQIVQLSIAYVLEHRGEVSVAWDAPFPVVQAMAVLEDGLEVTAGATGPGERPPHDPAQGQAPPPVKFYTLDVPDFVPGPCELATEAAREAGDDAFTCPPLLRPFSGAPVRISVSGLTTTSRWAEWTAVGVGVGLLVLVGVVLVVTPRIDPRRALLRQRDTLLRRLDRLETRAASGRDPGGTGIEDERAALLRALDRVYRQLDVLEGPQRAGRPEGASAESTR